jgi:CheY-like chemotaxis protein
MDADTAAHCFEPFWTTKGRSQGTGLGLSTVHAAVTQAGGRIVLDSTPGQGTTFVLWFPVAALDQAGGSEPSPDEGREQAGASNGHHETELLPLPGGEHLGDDLVAIPDLLGPNGLSGDDHGDRPEDQGNGEVVLLVEDEDELRRLAGAELERRGYTVVSAANAAEAFSAEKELGGRLDLLATDVMMPGMNGVELADRMQESNQALPVLLMSGHLDEGAIARYLLRDDADLLEKPYSLDELAHRVRLALDRRAAADASVLDAPESVSHQRAVSR